ncbi:5'-3' exoribonuclease pacman isoform X2 [Lasioglossum baleicum]|uniref:5'-3' exoribonuclease pacman isoform X2 n=1 Tax=Lasioglossum baleicum TaxID=434251 RepID=UPI003FCE3A0D
MGVPKFFRYISERYPCVCQFLKDYQIPVFDNLYLDVNGIIHGCSHPNDVDITFRITEETIFKNIFHYIEILFNIIQPQQLFFISIDGVAPRAKINQQRSRRFRVAKESEALEANAKDENGEVNIKDRFDSNCITPGTLFMAKLDEQLKYFISYKISTDVLWQKCKVILSGSRVPGEGEHKIMDYIRYMKAQPDYNPNTRHCLYGLDADLIMLGLCTHEPYFTLLREEVKFGKKQSKIQTPEETKFCLFHLSLLREYIDHEFSLLREKLPFPYDIEKIIDDWVLMGFLVGNDFVPHLPNLHIAHGAHSILYQVYMDVLPSLEGYINDTGTLRLDRFEKLMERLSHFDLLQFSLQHGDLKELESKMGKRFTECDKSICKIIEEDGDVVISPSDRELDEEFDHFCVPDDMAADELQERSDEDDDDEMSDDEMYNPEFVEHKKEYYRQKLECDNIDEKFLRTQAEAYVRAIQWNLNYYYNGCCSWSWYYPYHYAPYISDIRDFKDLKLEFDLGRPFLPFEQLLAVLPPYSRKLLPEVFQSLLTDEKSPIIEYYPKEFFTDLNGKQQEWEAVVLLPFIDEELLLGAMAQRYSKLTSEELARNKHGPMCLYFYTDEDRGVNKAPEYFPDTLHNHAAVMLINPEDILVPRSKLIKGLHPNVKLDICCPGFPTLRYIKHTASLEKAKVKVFQHHSYKDNMILHIVPSSSPEKDLTCMASELVGKTVYVEWPFLTEAQVVAVLTNETKLSLIDHQMGCSRENTREEEVKGVYHKLWITQAKQITETYKGRLGIDLGEIRILIHARPLIGSKYVFGPQGKLFFEKQWSVTPVTYAYQTIVKDISVYEASKAVYKTVDDIFVPGNVCFMLGHPHYGAMGTVVEPAVSKKSGRIRVSVNVSPELSQEVIKLANQKFRTKYMTGTAVAQRLGISSHMFSRVTGTIYVKPNFEDMSQKEIKHNIGLNLKFNKKNEEIVGYTRKLNGQWLYSTKVVKLTRDYMTKYPDLFERLSQNIGNVIPEKELFDGESGVLNDLMDWLKEQLQDMKTCPCGTNNVDSNLVKEIEENIDEFLADQPKEKLVPMQVKPHLLFKPGLHLRKAQPDPNAQTYLLDRVCCVKDNFSVPLGYKGTVIGIQTAENPLETMYDVVFDRTFTSGLSINGCSDLRGYRLSALDFINISHGERMGHGRGRSVAEMNAESMESWRVPSNQTSVDSRANSSANSSAFASYRKKRNQLPGQEQEAWPNPRIVQTRNNETTDQEVRLAPSSSFKWKQCKPGEDAVARIPEANKMIKSAVQQNSAAPENPQNRQSTAKPTMEFQALWNELHKPQLNRMKPPEIRDSKMNKSFPESAPQDPSAFLKAVLKISDENTQQSAQSAPPKILSSNTVPQKENKHARQSEKVKDEKTPIWYCTQLVHYYQLTRIGMPRYSYFTDGETNLIRAHIVLPDKRAFVSDPCGTHELAAGSAAKKVYTELNLSNVLPNMKLPPPLHWYATRQNNSWSPNLRPPGPPFFPPKPQPPQHFPQWTQKAQHTTGYHQPYKQNNQYMHLPQPKAAPCEQKSEIKNSTSFVPLQAQKKSRNIVAKQAGATKETNQCAKDNPQPVVQQKKKELPAKKPVPIAETTDKQKSTQSSSNQQVQSTQPIAKPKKSRIAAKFCIPSQMEETNRRKDSV